LNPPPSKIHLSRVGAVAYLNARPLIYGIENQVQLASPRELAEHLRSRKLDAGLIPIAEYLTNPAYQVLPHMAIGCRGPVRSVYLAHRVPLSKITAITLSPHSKTSNLLIQVLCAEFLQIRPHFTSSSESSSEAQVFIGDPALQARDRLLQEGFQLLDLGEVWHQHTQLPFVFAFWAVLPKIDAAPYLDFLLQTKTEGLRNIARIAANQNLLSPEIAELHLTREIRYDFGPQEQQSFSAFQKLCVRHQFIPQEVKLHLVKESVS
jgi:chorismate dehydratase